MRQIPTETLLGPLTERERKYAPPLLYVVGDDTLLRTRVRVAVVGSRDASSDGLARARRLAGLLVKRGVAVVSGLALGIDRAAHEAALDAGGSTIAVMPTPLDAISPRSHQALFDRIARDHLAVSEFGPGATVNKGNFVRRNRTMALVSHATVIIEAGDGSGTISQGWEAIRLGRPLFLTKSLVDRTDLTWPADLLDYGALVLEDPDDLYDALPSGAPMSPADLAF
ncbi:MAG: DNA-processing protein DprA [Myxococcota bacterium]